MNIEQRLNDRILEIEERLKDTTSGEFDLVHARRDIAYLITVIKVLQTERDVYKEMLPNYISRAIGMMREEGK